MNEHILYILADVHTYKHAHTVPVCCGIWAPLVSGYAYEKLIRLMLHSVG